MASDRNPLKGVRSESQALAQLLKDIQPDVIVAHSAKAGMIVRGTVRGRIPTVLYRTRGRIWHCQGLQTRCDRLGTIGRSLDERSGCSGAAEASEGCASPCPGPDVPGA